MADCLAHSFRAHITNRFRRGEYQMQFSKHQYNLKLNQRTKGHMKKVGENE